MSMLVKIHSKYNYSSRHCGAFLDLVTVDVVDTSVDNVKNNVSVNSSAAAQSFYTNSDVPVSLFGPGITSTHYDPNRHRGAFAPKDAAASAAAAAAPSSSTSANAAQNAAASAVPSSNSATISNS